MTAVRADELAARVASHLAAAEFDSCDSLLAEIRRIDPAHPALVSLEQSYALMTFAWPALREPYEPQPIAPPAADSIDIVVFHVGSRSQHALDASIDYLPLLDLCFESARNNAPRARRILLTDADTPLPPDLPADEVRRIPIDGSRLMYERQRVQEHYLQGRPDNRCSVFLDSDVVTNTDCRQLFAREFDVGLTWRSGDLLAATSPFNGGAIFAARGTGGAKFFSSALRCYDALADDPRIASLHKTSIRGWWGDQYALAVSVGYRAFVRRTTNGLRVDDARLRFFPCSTHNFTPSSGQQYTLDDLRRKAFVHFKGNTKTYMTQYLQLIRRGTP